jgi:hypothetical protein
MMKKDLDGMFKAFVVVLLVGILFTLISNAYMREKIQNTGGFTELYFNDHQNLPEDVRVNNSYNVSFTFTNHEVEPTAYVYSVDSPARNFSHEINLGVGESATVQIVVTPSDRYWNVAGFIDSFRTDVLKNFGNSTIETREVLVGRLGKILYENLSIKELESNPIRSWVVNNSTIQNNTDYEEVNASLHASGNQILLDTIERRVYATSIKKPFIIKLYKKGDRKGDELEIHYWQEVN